MKRIVQLHIKVLVAVLLTIVAVNVVNTNSVQAANLGNVAPWPANTTPNANGGSVFLLRDNPAAGAQRDVRFDIYLPAGTNIGSTGLILAPGTNSSADSNVCTTGSGTNDPDFLRVTITEAESLNTRVFNISYANACAAPVTSNNATGNNASNRLYARYSLNGLPGNNIESKTGMLKYTVRIDFTGNPDDTARFRISASVPGVANAILSPGTGGLTFPTVADWDEVIARGSDAAQRIVIPFGLCEASGSSVTKTIELYDADNGPNSLFWAHTVYFRIRDITTNTWVPMQGPLQNGSLSNGNTNFTPANGNSQRSGADFQMVRNHFYELHVYDIANINTIDVKLPAGSESAWGVPGICSPSIVPPHPAIDNVVLTSGISHSGDVEVGNSVTFSQNVSVSNFPAAPSQWGFNEEAIRVAWNTNTAPVQTNYDANNAGNTGLSPSVERQCLNGWAANCGTYVCNNGSTRLAATGCGAGVGGYRWRCAWNGKYEPASGWTGGQNAPGCSNIVQYQCRDANGNWQDQFRDFQGRANNACSNMWNCWAPSGRPNTFDPNYGAGYCRVFRCAYDPNPANYFYSAPGNNADDQCDKRCSGGTGARAPNWNPPGSLDDNCYIQPSFTVTCVFDNGVAVSEVVNNNGTFCDGLPGSSTTKLGATRGLLCAVTTAISSGWQGTPPGKGINGDPSQMRVLWGFDYNGPAQTCAQVGQRPYFHVYGGDVNANTSFMPCTAANTTTIRAFNNGGSYTGSGSQLASIARGTIEGFTSASISTQRPFGLTFANTTGGWGGNYRGTLDCIPDTTLPLYGGSNVVSGVIAGQDWRNYGNQDVYITGNVTYPAAFSLANIPSLKIITNGNIYISSGVGQVNGIFMAKGKIFTCAVANGAGGLRSPTPQEMEDNCESQLRVNGSLIANQVKLLRIVGSAGYAPLDPRSGGGLATAAELLRYTPDNWIRDMVTPPPTPTDAPIESIVNLPPIL